MKTPGLFPSFASAGIAKRNGLDSCGRDAHRRESDRRERDAFSWFLVLNLTSIRFGGTRARRRAHSRSHRSESPGLFLIRLGENREANTIPPKSLSSSCERAALHRKHAHRRGHDAFQLASWF